MKILVRRLKGDPDADKRPYSSEEDRRERECPRSPEERDVASDHRSDCDTYKSGGLRFHIIS